MPCHMAGFPAAVSRDFAEEKEMLFPRGQELFVCLAGSVHCDLLSARKISKAF